MTFSALMSEPLEICRDKFYLKIFIVRENSGDLQNCTCCSPTDVPPPLLAAQKCDFVPVVPRNRPLDEEKLLCSGWFSLSLLFLCSFQCNFGNKIIVVKLTQV